MPPRRVWLLNLAADAELARPGAVNPSRALEARCAQLASRLVGLVPDGDVVFGAGEAPVGVAWCPTPSALRRLRSVGAVVRDPPSLTVLRAVNSRAFAADLAQPLPGAAYVRDEAALDACLCAGSITGTWLLKRPFGYSGTGRLRVRGAQLDAAARRWIRAALAAGDGLQVEPEVERIEDHGAHGYLARDGAVTFGALTRQRVDARGQWEASERAEPDALSRAEQADLDATRERVALALNARGYHGPFGIDAFRWRLPSGQARYNALCEVNARYSMGWAVGMGDRRPDLDDT